jgi:hypothetical protein
MCTTLVLRGTEYTLTAGQLSVEELGPDRIPFAFADEGTTNGGQEQFRRVEDPCAIFDWIKEAFYHSVHK